MFWKNQEICNKMGTRICKIVEEMSEIIEHKVGNPKNSVSRNWAISDEIFQLFSDLHGSKVPKLNFAHGKSPKTNEKDLKIPILQPPDWKNPYWMSL